MEQQKQGLPGVNLAVGVVIFGILAFLLLAVVLMAPIINGPPDPNISIRLVGVEGLDPRLPAPVPPVFDLAVDVAGVSPRYHACGGGGGSKLRVSYHDIVLASALVPSFCIDGKLLEGGSAAGVVVVKARGGVDGANAMIRGDLRNLIWTERHVLGKVNFDVSGNLGKESGLGDLSFRVSSIEVNFAHVEIADFHMPWTIVGWTNARINRMTIQWISLPLYFDLTKRLNVQYI
uniref:Late embryogenesis abundant protein LEA-2 subgroup domain-containing protein n=2 Tax=Oryza TaxID=4527 RepID=A0A0D3ES01_9ORYZ